MTVVISGTAGIQNVLGSAAAPAESNTTSSNTGVYFPTSTSVGISTNGTLAMTVDASQNVGIGTSSPLVPLVVKTDTDFVVGIGKTSAGTGARVVGLNLAQNAYKDFVVDGATVQFATSGTERARIDSSGNLLVGQTATSTPPTSTKDIYAGGLWLNPSNRTAANAASAYWEASTGVFYRSTSSLRYKTNVVSYTKGLQDVMNLRAVSFNPKDGDKKDRVYAGFIAEEIDTLGLKEFVEYDAEGLPDSVAYAQITALLTKAIQEQQALITQLTDRIAALEAK